MNQPLQSSNKKVTSAVFLSALIPAFFRLWRARRALPILNPRNEFLSLGRVIELSALKYPNNIFLRFEDQTICYKEFNYRANKIANYLSSQGIGKGDVVVLLMENRPEFLINSVAIVKLGAVAALLNNSQKGDVLTHSINLVKPKVAIIGDEYLTEFEEINNRLDLEHIYFVPKRVNEDHSKDYPSPHKNLTNVSETFPTTNPSQCKKVHRKDSCFYIYTSGTTGMPKASITNHDRWLLSYGGFGHAAVQLNESDVFYCTLPFYHATAMLVCWGAIIAGGSTLVLKTQFSASEFWLDVEKYKVTAFGYVGELCRYLLNQKPSESDTKHSIRLILGNGLRPTVWNSFKERFNIPKIVEFYGASEGNVFCINFLNIDNCLGLGSPNMALVKYDKNTEQPIRDKNGLAIKVLKGEAGLLLGKVNKISPFTGYTDKNQSKKTLEKDVFQKGDVWFNTGDSLRSLGFHHFQFVDRLGDTFRWKGENVSSTEIENILLKNPIIEDCAVYGVEIPNTEGRIGMASLVLKDGIELNEELLNEFHRHCSKELPSYALPYFLRIKHQMATTATFKLQKSKLKEEAYDLKKVSDKLYFLTKKDNGSEESYLGIDETFIQKLANGEVKV